MGEPGANPKTSNDCLRDAYAALLRGDTAERDRLCLRAKVLLQAEQEAAAVERIMAVDFYVTAAGRVIPTERMLRAVGVRQ